jgi:hypothetical protein
MIGPSIRFQDFELDARARLTATATFSQAEVDAIRREAFATGQKEGAGNAATVIATARAEQAEALCDVVRQIEGLQHAIDQYLSESLDRFEQILRAALAHTLPSAASAAALQRLPDTLRQLAAAMPDVTVEAALSPETEDAIRSSAQSLPPSVAFVPDPSLPFGTLRLRWRGGGGVFSADAALTAVQALLDAALAKSSQPAFPDDPDTKTQTPMRTSDEQ